MDRRSLVLLGLFLPLAAQAASLKELNLQKNLQLIASNSQSAGPRPINSDLTDLGYTAEGNILTNHIEVSAKQAKDMRQNVKATYFQLGASVCRNPKYIKLMKQGAVLNYRFTEEGSRNKITEKFFTAEDCSL